MTDREIAAPDRRTLFARLRAATPARVGLARSGVSIATPDHLAFQLAHAQARDAVHEALDAEALVKDLRSQGREAVRLASQAGDRTTYLARPDLGKRLDETSRGALDAMASGCDIAIVVADGLSARAVASHAVPVLDRLMRLLREQRLTTAPVHVVEQARVAIGDEIGALLGAAMVCVLIGERPGLSSPDSLGIYLTWQPRVGRTDAERNCISNIRPAGMSYDEAASRCAWLIGEARARKLTGVALKDEFDALTPPAPNAPPALSGS